jgi:hypothetical protein
VAQPPRLCSRFGADRPARAGAPVPHAPSRPCHLHYYQVATGNMALPNVNVVLSVGPVVG